PHARKSSNVTNGQEGWTGKIVGLTSGTRPTANSGSATPSRAAKGSGANYFRRSLLAIRDRQLGGDLKVLAELVVACCLADLLHPRFELTPIDVDCKGIEKQVLG